MNIGIDIGGSHVGVGIVEDDGTIVKFEETYINSSCEKNMANYMQSVIINILERWSKDGNVQIQKIGIGVPGEIENGDTITCFNLGIKDYNFKEEIQKKFPNCQIRLKNDAKCAGLAEKNIGSIKDFDNAIFMCLGTGIGSAVFKNGVLIESENHVGHITLIENGEQCNCGKRGCFERYASMRHFKGEIRKSLNLPNNVEGDDLLNIVKSNFSNLIVENTVNKYIHDLCSGLSIIINKYEPEAICIGGGFVKYSELLLNKIIDGLKDEKYNNKINYIPKIVVAKFGNDAGIVGSALFI